MLGRRHQALRLSLKEKGEVTRQRPQSRQIASHVEILPHLMRCFASLSAMRCSAQHVPLQRQKVALKMS